MRRPLLRLLALGARVRAVVRVVCGVRARIRVGVVHGKGLNSLSK